VSQRAACSLVCSPFDHEKLEFDVASAWERRSKTWCNEKAMLSVATLRVVFVHVSCPCPCLCDQRVAGAVGTQTSSLSSLWDSSSSMHSGSKGKSRKESMLQTTKGARTLPVCVLPVAGIVASDG